MGYLSADELDELRTDAAATLPDTCSIYTVTRTVDSIGGMSASGTVIRSSIPCRYAAGADGWEQLVGSKPQHGNGGVFSMNGTVSLNLTDIIYYSGVMYNIKGINIKDSERMITRVAVERSDG